MMLHDLGQAQVLVQSNLLRREQIVALREFGAGQRSIEIRKGCAHFLGVGDPLDGVRKLDAGSVGKGAAEQDQRHGQQESRQDLDFDGCVNHVVNERRHRGCRSGRRGTIARSLTFQWHWSSLLLGISLLTLAEKKLPHCDTVHNQTWLLKLSAGRNTLKLRRRETPIYG